MPNEWLKRSRFKNKQGNFDKLSDQAVFLKIRLPIYIPVLMQFQQSASQPTDRKVLLLSKGAAGPNRGRSTNYIADIIKKVSSLIDSRIEIKTFHDDTNIDEFSYKGRPRFFRNHVLPQIASMRDELVQYYGAKQDPEGWQNISIYIFLSIQEQRQSLYLH